MANAYKMTILFLACIGVLTACEPPPAANTSAGQKAAEPRNVTPESLMDLSTEVVNMNLSTRDHLAQLSQMVAKDPPSRAALDCPPADLLCRDARKLFDTYGIPVQFSGGGRGVTLMYERVIARDCDPRNQDQPRDAGTPGTIGCSVAGNMVQMVGDKRQFASPTLMDFPDSEKSVNVYEEQYLYPSDPVRP